MNIEAEYADTKVAADWSWPVQIGLLEELFEMETVTPLNKPHWLKTLAHVFGVNRVRRKSNVLVLNGALEEVYKCLNTYDFLIKTDLVVLFLESSSTSIQEGEQVIRELQNISYNSFFVTHIPKDRSPLFWLDELIFHLSHNNNIGEAIDAIGWTGKLVVSEELLYKSSVENVMESMLDDIVKGANYTNYEFNEVLTEEIKREIDEYSPFTGRSAGDSPAEIVADLKIKKESFRYDNESGESTIIKHIAIRHSNNVSDMLDRFKISGNEAKDDQQEAVKISTSRYLQCVFHDAQQKPAHHALLTSIPYTLTVKIDTPDEEFMQGGVVTADATSEDLKENLIELDLLNEFGTLNVDAWKLSHHGSKKSNQDYLMEIIQTQKVLISSDGKRYHHPDKETIAKLLTYQKRELDIFFNYTSKYNKDWGGMRLGDDYRANFHYPDEEGYMCVKLEAD